MSITLQTIRKKATNNTLEVEHLLKAAAARLEGLPTLMKELTASEQWSETGKTADGGLVVPFAKWGQIAAAYCAEGYEGLAPYASMAGCESFVLGMIEEVHESQGVACIISWFQKAIGNPARNLPLALQVAKTLNLMLCFAPHIELPCSCRDVLRNFAHSLIAMSLSESQKATPVLLLRSVGNASSLALIKALPAFSPPWDGIIGLTSRAIKKRLALSSSVADSRY